MARSLFWRPYLDKLGGEFSSKVPILDSKKYSLRNCSTGDCSSSSNHDLQSSFTSEIWMAREKKNWRSFKSQWPWCQFRSGSINFSVHIISWFKSMGDRLVALDSIRVWRLPDDKFKTFNLINKQKMKYLPLRSNKLIEMDLFRNRANHFGYHYRSGLFLDCFQLDFCAFGVCMFGYLYCCYNRHNRLANKISTKNEQKR